MIYKAPTSIKNQGAFYLPSTSASPVFMVQYIFFIFCYIILGPHAYLWNEPNEFKFKFGFRLSYQGVACQKYRTMY